MYSVDDLDSLGCRFYRAALRHLIDAHIPFLVGGAYALETHTGIVRRTKDFDIFMVRENVKPAMHVLSTAGYQTELTFPHWIAKAFCGEDFIDIIFSSGNGMCAVDEAWFQYATTGRVLEMDLKLCPAEETIWQKAFILKRDRCDVADVAHLFRHRGSQLDWPRLLARFDEHWRVLLAQIVLFDFIYPGHRNEIPQAVRKELVEKAANTSVDSGEAAHVCHGTLLSATQYLHDVDLEDYEDGRLPPYGPISPADLAVWTANFMKPK